MGVRDFSSRIGDTVGDQYHLEITPNQEGERIDVVLAVRLPAFSRSQIQRLIRTGRVLVNEEVVKASFKPKTGDQIRVEVPAPSSPTLRPEKIPLSILYETPDFLVLNKPAGLVVHPAPGHENGTLVNALLYHVRDLSGIGGVLRPGIVHRLDKDTSGVLLVAKNDLAHEELSRLFKHGKIRKTYLALVKGEPAQREGKIDLPIGRHPVRRKTMSVVSRSGKSALTLYEVVHRFRSLPISCLVVRIKTGRTHQIRVHLSAIGHPVIGDRTYGRKNVTRMINHYGDLVERQLLHALKLEWHDPRTGGWISVTAPIPEDMNRVLAFLAELDGDSTLVIPGPL